MKEMGYKNKFLLLSELDNKSLKNFIIRHNILKHKACGSFIIPCFF